MSESWHHQMKRKTLRSMALPCLSPWSKRRRLPVSRRVDELGATEELFGALLEVLEAKHIDRDVPRVEIVEDALC